jgi:hypothetical protein
MGPCVRRDDGSLFPLPHVDTPRGVVEKAP